MFIIKIADHDGNHNSIIEKNVPIVLILPNRWLDGAESLRWRPQAVYAQVLIETDTRSQRPL